MSKYSKSKIDKIKCCFHCKFYHNDSCYMKRYLKIDPKLWAWELYCRRFKRVKRKKLSFAELINNARSLNLENG